MRQSRYRYSKETRGGKKCAATKEKKRQFLRLGEKQFHFTSLSFVMKHVREEKEEKKSFVS